MRWIWSKGYSVNTISKFGDENTISKYVRNQENEKTIQFYIK